MIRDVFGDGERELASVDSFDSIGQASPRHRQLGGCRGNKHDK